MDSVTTVLTELRDLKEGFTKLAGAFQELTGVVTGLVSKVNSLEAEVKELRSEVKELHNQVDELTVVVNKIYAEMLRFTGDKSNMKLSVWAFCRLYDLTFSYGDLSTMGRQATRESRKLGASVETVADPRFGLVNVYEPEVLEQLFLSGEFDEH